MHFLVCNQDDQHMNAFNDEIVFKCIAW